MRFVVRKARRGVLKRNQRYARIVFDNGEVFAHTETYNNIDDLLDAIDTVKSEADTATIDREDQ